MQMIYFLSNKIPEGDFDPSILTSQTGGDTINIHN